MTLQTKITKLEQYFLIKHPPPKSDELLVKVARLMIVVSEKEAKNLAEYPIEDIDRMTHEEFEEFFQKFPEWEKHRDDLTKDFVKANIWKD